MDLVTKEELFDRDFISTLNNDYSDYLNHLLLFITDENNSEMINEKIEEFQNALIKYILSIESDEDYDIDIDEVRKSRLERAYYNVNNYLMSLKPSKAITEFMNTDFLNLINKSNSYCENYKNDIKNNILCIKAKTPVEYKYHKAYKDSINDILSFLEDNTLLEVSYPSMRRTLIGKNEASLMEIDEYTKDLLVEACIINLFDTNSRCQISKILNNPKNPNVTYSFANICDNILMNYTMLSLYSNDPEKLKISDSMFTSIVFEIENNMIEKNEIIDFLFKGHISFNEFEKNYIMDNFVDSLFNDDDLIEKNNITRLAK